MSEAWLQQPLNQSAPEERLNPPFTPSGPILDGKLDEPFWTHAIDDGRYAAPRSDDGSNSAATTVLFRGTRSSSTSRRPVSAHPDFAYPPPPGPRLR
ncbi:MAG: hypothetical protein R3B96_21765 [Pirellulaceae bacterium]